MEKVIKLWPDQIPLVWEGIKYAAVRANDLSDENVPAYLHNLLVDLLCSKAECFTAYDEDRIPKAFYVVRVIKDNITSERSLFGEILYSFKGTSLEEWATRFKTIADYARKENCKFITTYSNVEKVFEITKLIGFKERYRSLIYRLDGGI